MKRLLVHVEGRTEEQFVNNLLAPYLFTHGWIQVTPRAMGSARQRVKRQGVKPWTSVLPQLLRNLQEDNRLWVTVMVDYYAMPQDGAKSWPGRFEATMMPFENKATHIAARMVEDVKKELPNAYQRFIPHIQMHEFEALLFSDCKAFADGIYQVQLESDFRKIRTESGFVTPEHINDSPDTAPSKRIEKLFPEYQKAKPLYGNLAALAVGIPAMRRECSGFNLWLTRLEEIGAA